mgnify:CR=1 FL=1
MESKTKYIYSEYWRLIENTRFGLPQYDVFELRYALRYFSHRIPPEERVELDACMNTYFYNYSSRVFGGFLPGKIFANKTQKSIFEAREFAMNHAQLIYNAHRNEMYQSACPKCQRLRRSPQAKVCLWCGHDEHVF